MRISSTSMHQRGLRQLFNAQQQVDKRIQQISTGKKILQASEDPVASQKMRTLKSGISELENYQNTNTVAENTISLVETTLNSIIDSLMRVDELHKRAANSVLQQRDRDILAQELSQISTELVDLSNTRDANSDYIFSGYQNEAKSYINQDGNFIYQGDDGQRQVQIGSSVFVPISYSGYDIFESTKNGNGTFVTADGSVVNTGSAIIDNGSVIDPLAYVDDTYSIDFVTNGSGKLGYTVTGATSGQVIPGLPATMPADAPEYMSGGNISFNGIEILITGTPDVGDDFEIQPSQSQNMFKSIQNIIGALRKPINSPAGQAQYLSDLNRNGSALDQSMDGLLLTMTKIGANSKMLDSEKTINDSLIIQIKKTLSSVEDLDPTEAISQLSFEMSTLQMAQASFAKVQQLSLFNFL